LIRKGINETVKSYLKKPGIITTLPARNSLRRLAYDLFAFTPERNPDNSKNYGSRVRHRIA
jgi:hypothetical protein